jgi:YD repeat-containing protein
MSLLLEVPVQHLATTLAPLRGPRTDPSTSLSPLPLRVAPAGDGTYEVLDGFKRLAGWRHAGHTHVPVIVEDDAGDLIYQFAYTLGTGGVVTQTDVTDPRGIVRRVTFDAALGPLTDTRALGTAEQQTTTYEWQANTNLLLARTDALGRRTAYSYDATGNLTSLTRLAGTADATTTTLTYEPTFSEVASITDPLGHTTTFGRDSLGNLTSITRAPNQPTTLTYNPAGQPLTLTDPAGTTQLAYNLGDLATVTDPCSTRRRGSRTQPAGRRWSPAQWASRRGTITMC